MGKKATQPEGERSWDGVLRREIDVELRAINDDERSFEVIASTEDLDSHGDVVRQFWDLSRFSKNGVVLWNHNLAQYGGSAEDSLPIGRAEDVRVEGKKLLAKVFLLKGDAENEPLVDKIWRRVQQKVLKAVSVGFRPGQVTRKANAAGETEFFEIGSKDRPNELREISLVPMGSNPNAVAKSIAWEREHLKSLVGDDDNFGRAAANKTAESGRTDNMDEELKKAIEAKAVADKALESEKSAREAAEKSAAEYKAKAEKLESELVAEKKVIEKLTADLAAANKSLADVAAKLAKSELDSLQGVKFAPAEREELDQLVKDVGIDRVKTLLSKRPDIALTQPVEVEGKPVENKNAPAPVEADPSAEIFNLAQKAIN